MPEEAGIEEEEEEREREVNAVCSTPTSKRKRKKSGEVDFHVFCAQLYGEFLKEFEIETPVLGETRWFFCEERDSYIDDSLCPRGEVSMYFLGGRKYGVPFNNKVCRVTFYLGFASGSSCGIPSAALPCRVFCVF